MLVIEPGSPGRGASWTLSADAKATPWVSGSAVFDAGGKHPTAIKMMCGCFAAKSADFLNHHDIVSVCVYVWCVCLFDGGVCASEQVRVCCCVCLCQ